MSAVALKAAPMFLTYEDYLHVPDDGRRYELLQGELAVSPAPFTVHQRVSRNLELILASFVEAGQLGEVFYAPIDVILDRGTVVQPDLVYVARQRLGIVSRRGIEAAPDLVVEILSESTADRDRGIKQALYAQYGVAHYWIIDVEAKCIEERLRNDAGGFELLQVHREPDTMHSALFPALAIDLQRVFRPMLSPEATSVDSPE